MGRDDKNQWWSAVDPLAIERPARRRYIQIRELFLARKITSFPVKTEDLANVVKGREDVALPGWAEDSEFECELETLIQGNPTILVCLNCDHIIGFLDYSPDKEEFSVAEVVYVFSREDFACQYCHSTRWSMFPSERLRSGEKVGMPARIQEVMKNRQGQEVSLPYAPPSSKNEQFLDSVLRRLYPFRPEESTDRIRLEKKELSAAIRLAQRISPGLGEAGEKTPPVLFLRPVYTQEYRNVLGTVWESAKKILGDEYAHLAAAAIGILPRDELTASAHLGPEGEMAVIVRRGFFQHLYTLNQLLLYILFGSERPERNRSDLVVLFRHKITNSNKDAEALFRKVDWDCQTEKEYWSVHAISNIQQEFVLLHELGHLQAWLQGSPDDLASVEEAEDYHADSWAMNLVLRRGTGLHHLDVYLNALLYLFEYWHSAAVIVQGQAGSARERWNKLHALSRQHGISLRDKEITAVRGLVDQVLREKEEEYE